MGNYKLSINQATMMKTPMEDFLQSISAAGFEGVELRRDETFAYLENHSVQELKDLLDAANLKVVSWNAIELFSLCNDDAFQGMCDYTERLMQIGNEIGCDLIIAVPSFANQSVFPEDQMMSKTIERFQVLRALADKYTFRMGFEPLGFPNNSIRTIPQAMEVLQGAEEDGLPPSGLIIDTFHFFLAEQPANDLLTIPLDRLWLIHLDDCVEKPLDELQDGDRVWPGEGFFDLKGVAAALKKMKYNGYISLELFNPEYWTMDPAEAAETSFQTTKKFTSM
jgi:2-keto-myo-inositol isomerase